MSAIYHVIEYGHRTTFYSQYASGTDIFYCLSSAVPAAAVNGGNLTAALLGIDNSSGFHGELPAQGRPLEQLDLEEAMEYDHDFLEEEDVGQRVTIDLDKGVMHFEHNRHARTTAPFQNGDYPVPPEVMEALKQAREAPTIRLKDLVLLGLPASDVYLVHGQYDVGTVPAADLGDLSERGQSEFADLLGAKVDAIQSGAYGVELVMTGINSVRLADYDRVLASQMQSGASWGMFRPVGQNGSGAAEQPPLPGDIPNQGALRAVTDYLRFEQETSEIWPWFLSAEEMLGDERTLHEVSAALHHDPEHGYDTEEIHQALNEAFGVNPTLERGQEQTMAP